MDRLDRGMAKTDIRRLVNRQQPRFMIRQIRQTSIRGLSLDGGLNLLFSPINTDFEKLNREIRI